MMRNHLIILSFFTATLLIGQPASRAQVPRFKETPYSSLEGLRSPDVGARLSAASALLRFKRNPMVATALAKSVAEDPAVAVRQKAATTLAKIGTGTSKAALARAAVCDPDTGTRDGLATFGRRAKVVCHETKITFGELDQPLPTSESELVDLLTHPDAATRRAAIKGLAKRKSSKGARKLWTMSAQDPVWKLRALALKAISRLYKAKAFAVLKHTLTQDPDARARAVALSALAQVKHPRAVKMIATSARVEQVALVQTAAVKALALVGNKPAIRELSFVAQMHKSEHARAKAVAALAGIKKHRKQIKKVMASVLKNDRSGLVRAAALKALSTDTSNAACKARASRIDDPSAHVRAALIEQLGGCSKKIARPALEHAAQADSDSHVRKSAVGTLAKLGAKRSRLVMLEILLQDKDAEVRRAAYTAVKGFKAKILYRALSEVAKSDPDTSMRRDAVAQLAGYKAMMAVPALAAVLQRDRVEEVRLAAARSLGKFSDALAYKALRDAATKDPSAKVRKAATTGAAKSPAQRAWVDALLPQTIDPSTSVRLKAVKQLCSLQAPRTYRALVRALWVDGSSDVRTAVARGFSEIDHPLADVGLVVAHDTDSDGGLVRTVEQTQATRVQRLMAVLAATKHPDVQERVEAVKSILPSPFKKARTTLEQVLVGDEHPDVRRAAALAVARYKDHRALQTLVKASQKELDSKTRQKIVKLYNMLRKAWSASRASLRVAKLVRSLQVGKLKEQVQAVQALGILRDRQAFTFLQKAAASKHPELRYEGVLALTIFGDTKTLSVASRAEKDEATRNRLLQLDFLRKGADAKILEAIGSAKQSEVLVGVQAAAIKKVKKAVPWLARVALSNPQKQHRTAAVRTLALYDHSLATWAIKVAADHDASRKLRGRMWRWAVYSELKE